MSCSPAFGFIVTSMVLPSRSVVRFYNKRGTAEQWIKEGKQATHWTRLSCHRFRANEVRLPTERPGLQSGQPLAQTGAAAADQALVAHESSAAAGENRRPPGEACAVLLAPAGRRASDPAAVRRHAAEDLGATGAGRLTPGLSATKSAWRRKSIGVERCLRDALKAGARVGSTSSAASTGSDATCDEEIWRAERRVGVIKALIRRTKWKSRSKPSFAASVPHVNGKPNTL